MLLRLLTTALGLALLAACSSKPEDSTSASTTGAAGTGAAGGNGAAGMASSELSGGPNVAGSQHDLEVNVGDRVFFAFDSSNLDDKSRQTLDRQAAWLNKFGGTNVTVEGHTDERGTREYNLALGERRATAAKNYLASLGVGAHRMTTISYGEERPFNPGHDEKAWAENRVAVTVVNVSN